MNPFSKACGIEEKLHLKVGGQLRTFSSPFVLIGSHPRADIVVNRRAVPRLLAYLQTIDGALFCVDLSGRGSLRWDDGRKLFSGWLYPGQTLRVGPLKVRPADVAENAMAGGTVRQSALAAKVGECVAEMEVSQRVTGGMGDGTSCLRVDRVLSLVGRAPGCAVHLPARSVSDFHAALLWTARGLWAIDLLGSGGVTINGWHARTASLSDGDELRIGCYAIRLRLDGSHSPPRRGLQVAEPAVPTRADPLFDRAPHPASNGPECDDWDGPWHGQPIIDPTRASASRELAAPTAAELLGTAATPEILDSSALLSAPVPLDESVLLEGLVHLANRFGQTQQRQIEELMESVIGRFGQATESMRDEQSALREEVQHLRQLIEGLAQDGKIDPTRIPSPSRAERPRAQDVPPDNLGEFYTWLAGRSETFQDEQRGRWKSMMERLFGRARDWDNSD